MTDFCLTVLQKETTQLGFKGTIFREGRGGVGGGGSLRLGGEVQWMWDGENGK